LNVKHSSRKVTVYWLYDARVIQTRRERTTVKKARGGIDGMAVYRDLCAILE